MARETQLSAAAVTRRLLPAALLLATCAGHAAAQHYRVRLDAGSQAVSFRSLVQDSIAVTAVVASPGGGLQTPDGYAVRCGAGDYCFFMRPGPALRGMPATTSASVVLWGLGAPGLTLRATGRLTADLGPDRVWPGTEPAAQLIEGYVEYRRDAVVGRAGRQLLTSRLEHLGFDGGWVRTRWDEKSLEFAAYGGWGLGQAAAVPASSPALNPLDEWRPRDRQLVAGAEASWRRRYLDARAEYRREIDPVDNYFVSERSALSLGASVAALRATGGVDYNIAEGGVGSADVRLTFVQPAFSLSGGARRYRPYFSLWTLWGAFSPVPYNAVNTSAEVRPAGWLSLNARGEWYRYESAEVSTALVPNLLDRGWRASAGAYATAGSQWTFQGSYGLERGPGAAGNFADGAIRFAPGARFSLDLYGGTMARPLELRWYDATSRWVGGRSEWSFDAQRRVWADVAFVDDQRERPDAAASSLEQLRLRAGMSLAFGSDADRSPLPPARRPTR